jgi:hypothetical protein
VIRGTHPLRVRQVLDGWRTVGHQHTQRIAMSNLRQKPWRRWLAVVAGALLLLKTLVVTVSKLFSFAHHEAQARGGDVNFVLGLAGRRRGSR